MQFDQNLFFIIINFNRYFRHVAQWVLLPLCRYHIYSGSSNIPNLKNAFEMLPGAHSREE